MHAREFYVSHVSFALLAIPFESYSMILVYNRTVSECHSFTYIYYAHLHLRENRVTSMGDVYRSIHFFSSVCLSVYLSIYLSIYYVLQRVVCNWQLLPQVKLPF